MQRVSLCPCVVYDRAVAKILDEKMEFPATAAMEDVAPAR